MTPADIDAARLAARTGRLRVTSVEVSTGRVIVKRQRPARSGAWRRAVGALARAFRLPLLPAVPARGGARAQEIEVERLRALAAAGVRVPEVLHVDAGFIVLSRIAGPSLMQLVEAGGRDGFEAWRRGLAALVDTHARGGYLSDAVARNFILGPAGVAMIGFESDPLDAMPLEAAQARDWLAYLRSTVWLLDRPQAEIQAAVAVRLADERAPVRARLEAAGGRLAVLRHLPLSRSAWGPQVAGASALGRLFPLPVSSVTTLDGTL